MTFDDVLYEFGIAVGKLKRAYAEEYNKNPNEVAINIDEFDCLTIWPTDVTGDWIGAYRVAVDTSMEEEK